MKQRTFLRDLMTAAHLIAFGVAGFVVLTALIVTASTGIALLPVLLIGLIPLALFALGLAGVSRLEELRVSGLFHLNLAPRALRTSPRTDFWRVLHTLWLQVTDSRNWRGMLHFAIISVLGAVTLGLLRLIGQAVRLTVEAARSASPVEIPIFNLTLNDPVAHVVAAALFILALVGIWALARAHRSISMSMLAPSAEAALRQEAVVATQRRDDAMQAAQIERTRIERDLHDGVQPRLVSVGMTLGMAKAKLEQDPAAAAALIEEAHASTKAAITELRQLARGFHPAVLEDRGLDAALSALVAESHIPIQLDIRTSTRCTKQTEAAMYFVIAESLTNAAKHSDATMCRVTVLQRDAGMLWARIEDDGRGGARRVPGGGIDGIANRVTAAGGTFALSSPASGPTTIEVSLPCGY